MTLLACDLGGTRIKLGLVRQGRVRAQEEMPAQADLELKARLPEVASRLRQIAATHGLALGDCAGISVSFPSVVDSATGRVRGGFGKFANAAEVDLRGWARTEFGLPLAVENDARMALIGEWQHGAGRGCDNLAMITLGTGLGTAAVIQGKVLRGQHGQAGCLGGHLTVRYDGRPCHCGNLGCAEAEASTAFLAEVARERAEFASSGLAQEPLLNFAIVFRHAAVGDSCARAICEHCLRVWSSLAVNLIHAYDPERLVLGGGIMASADVILPAIQEHVARHAHTPWGKVRVVASELGDQAALLAGEWLLAEQSGRGS